MKDYVFLIMSVDPMGDPEDNHQKYRQTVQASSESIAENLVEADFKRRGLPIFWIKLLSSE
jgi:hypothetical protein